MLFPKNPRLSLVEFIFVSLTSSDYVMVLSNPSWLRGAHWILGHWFSYLFRVGSYENTNWQRPTKTIFLEIQPDSSLFWQTGAGDERKEGFVTNNIHRPSPPIGRYLSSFHTQRIISPNSFHGQHSQAIDCRGNLLESGTRIGTKKNSRAKYIQSFRIEVLFNPWKMRKHSNKVRNHKKPVTDKKRGCLEAW